MKKFFILSFFILQLSFLLFSLPAKADDPLPASKPVYDEISGQFAAAGLQTGLVANDPRYTATLIIKVVLGLLGTIFFVQIVYAGFLWMTAGGDEKKVEKAQKFIKNGVIGLVIILASYGIVLLVTVYALRGTTYSPVQPYQLENPSMPRY